MSLVQRWLAFGILLVLPHVVLGIAGFAWLYEHGYLVHWAFAAAGLSVAWYLAQRRGMIGLAQPPEPIPVQPSETWSKTAQAAWGDVESLAASLRTSELPLDRAEPIIELFRKVFETVARRYHPRSRDPLLEVPVPHLLRVAELVAHDLREALSARIPGSHVLTVNDLRRLQRMARVAPTLYRLYRLVGLVINPATALAREINIYAQNKLLEASTQDTRTWAISFAVRQAGYYAIELYSGNLVLQNVDFSPFMTRSSRDALANEQLRDQAIREEPIRILVLGQVKAGKSSLINALFGEVRAAVDVVPRTRAVEPYVLSRDGLERVIVLDTAGYEDASRAAQALRDARDEVIRSDLILLVTSALGAARDADRRLLDEVRALFQTDPDRELPPVIVPLTKIDSLRPIREWEPPYDIARPTSAKARSIRDAIDATASDLHLDPSRVIPVCLLPDRMYNVNESLIPVILESLPAAARLRYLRSLREFKTEQTWNQFHAQAVATGQSLVSLGGQWLATAGRAVDDLFQIGQDISTHNADVAPRLDRGSQHPSATDPPPRPK